MRPEGQVWKPGPPYPATMAAWPPAWLFRIRVLMDVARRPSGKAGTNVPSYSGGLAAA